MAICICTAGYGPMLGVSDFKQDVDDTIKFVKEKLWIDLSEYRDQMLDAKYSGRLEFTYLGPGKIMKEGNTEYNCYLTMFRETKYFFSITGYDSRTNKTKFE